MTERSFLRDYVPSNETTVRWCILLTFHKGGGFCRTISSRLMRDKGLVPGSAYLADFHS